MKKTKIIALMMVAAMMVGSLTGCGSRTKATDITIDDGDTIIVDTEDLETETDVNIEDTDDEDEILDTEVIGDDTDETVSDFAGAEDENIVLYAEKGHQDYIGQKDMAFEEKNVSFVAETDITLYDGDGYVAGYVKTGGNVTVTEGSLESTWDRFENPFVEGDYLYILREFVPSETEVKVTTNMVKQSVIEQMNMRAFELPTILDNPTSDMEMYEFRMYSNYEDKNLYDYDIWFYLNNNGVDISYYMTYAIETVDDDGDVVCRIYYKDAYEDWKAAQEQ